MNLSLFGTRVTVLLLGRRGTGLQSLVIGWFRGNLVKLGLDDRSVLFIKKKKKSLSQKETVCRSYVTMLVSGDVGP